MYVYYTQYERHLQEVVNLHVLKIEVMKLYSPLYRTIHFIALNCQNGGAAPILYRTTRKEKPNTGFCSSKTFSCCSL